MGRAGSALDNAVIESWHSTLEFELRQLEHFATKAQARRRVAAWIEEYNHDRRHSSLGMLSPVAYELATCPAARPRTRRPQHERPLPRAQHGAVLAGIKATPSGWPPASLDPGSGRRPPAATGSRPGQGSDKFRSLRFQGIDKETIVEVSTKNSPTGQRMLTKPYPKDNEPRTLGLPPDLLTQLADSIWASPRSVETSPLRR